MNMFLPVWTEFGLEYWSPAYHVLYLFILPLLPNFSLNSLTGITSVVFR